MKIEQEVRAECRVGEHRWEYIEEPQGNFSGYHVDRCTKCGKVISYDTSD